MALPNPVLLPGRGGRDLHVGPALPCVMGIVNLTPDSFSDGGAYAAPLDAVTAALQLERDGAAILDLGAESTRPGAEPVSAEEELARLLPVLEALRPQTQAVISIDTMKAGVARACLERGADWINDVTALTHDPEMAHVVRDFDCPAVLMHIRGTPKTMQDAPSYEDALAEVRDELAAALERALAAGIRRERLLLDPGIGFGKRFEDNLALLRGMASLHELGAPLLLGTSRKGLLGRILAGDGEAPPARERDAATLATLAVGHRAGVSVHRVHNARYASDFLRILLALEDPIGA